MAARSGKQPDCRHAFRQEDARRKAAICADAAYRQGGRLRWRSLVGCRARHAFRAAVLLQFRQGQWLKPPRPRKEPARKARKQKGMLRAKFAKCSRKSRRATISSIICCPWSWIACGARGRLGVYDQFSSGEMRGCLIFAAARVTLLSRWRAPVQPA